ncbi:protein BIC1 [Abrus precatorius]|uniref:Protein BIC1 n=1 Tax=Abrus precatorius TaxID=3816 RepID=A0A8B8MDW3_ABRPR|nr:protein BIC1 [Abrus precatorius]
MKDRTPSMAHHQQHSMAESGDHIVPPHQPLKLKKPHQPKHKRMGQEQEKNTLRHTPSASKVHNKVDFALDVVKEGSGEAEDSGRERLKRHRIEVAGRVWIPDMWGQEEFLKDWIDCTAFDAALVPSRIVMARAALVEEGRRTTAGGLRIENRP